jgi:hypothetical protein
MKMFVLVSLVVVLSIPSAAAAQAPDDKAAIRQAALDYLEGWYTADAVRMDRALHPDLVKRAIFQTGDVEKFVSLTKTEMVESTKQGGGKGRPAQTRNIKVEILDVYRGIATVRTECADYVDYLHLAKSDGQWKIVNVLWQTFITERQQIAIDPKVLPSYAGDYEVKPGFVLTVTVENDQLFVQATGQQKLPVYPSSPTEFFLKVTEAQLTFVKNSEGKVTQAILHQGGNDTPAKKIK